MRAHFHRTGQGLEPVFAALLTAMSKQNKRPQIPNQAHNAVAAAAQQQMHHQLQPVVTTQVQQYSGQIPPPDLLKSFDDIIPGTAARLIQWAEDEQTHRRRLESDAQAANIAAQQRQLETTAAQVKGVLRSDLIGQVFGFLVCVVCVGGAIYLAVNGQPGVGAALTVIPTGAVIYAFRGQIFGKKDAPAK